jgi:hypothetical protein
MGGQASKFETARAMRIGVNATHPDPVQGLHIK